MGPDLFTGTLVGSFCVLHLAISFPGLIFEKVQVKAPFSEFRKLHLKTRNLNLT